MNSTTFEDFTSEINNTDLINLCVSSLNIDPTQEFLNILQGISLSIFDVEGSTNSLNELNSIVVKEVSKYILAKRRDLLFKVISPKKYYENISISTETPTLLNFQEISSIFLDNLSIDYSSNYVVNSSNNTISFKERLAPEKDLWSENIIVRIDPGNYTSEQYLEELEDLMTVASKVKNFYNFFYDDITNKVVIFTTEEKLDWPTRKTVRNCSKKGDFLINREHSTTLNLLGFSNNSLEEAGNIFTGSSRMKYYAPAFLNVKILDEDTEEIIFDFDIPSGVNHPASPANHPLSLRYDLVRPIAGLITRVFPEDTELSIAGKIEYIVVS
jgi:hypothetical protein